MNRRLVAGALCVAAGAIALALCAANLRDGAFDRLAHAACRLPRHCSGRRPRITETKLTIKTVEQALIHFQTDHEENCPRSLSQLFEEKYLTKRPLDAWDAPLRFVCPGEHDRDGADVSSAGKDRQWGTADDLNSWELP